MEIVAGQYQQQTDAEMTAFFGGGTYNSNLFDSQVGVSSPAP